MSRTDDSARQTVRVWDLVVRLGHWLLVLSVTLSWLTRHGGGLWHELLGYVALGVVLGRLLWGWTGSQYARFADFVHGPNATLVYARHVLAGCETRYIGHNPLGGWMVVVLLVAVMLVCFSGWLYTTDRFWGVAWVEALHSLLSDVLLVLIVVHVSGVAYASYRHRENLIAAMVHGQKRRETTKGHAGSA